MIRHNKVLMFFSDNIVNYFYLFTTTVANNKAHKNEPSAL